MKLTLSLIAAIFFYLIFGLYLAQYRVGVLPDELVPEAPQGFFDYKGVTNVHTDLSSGSGDVERVIGAAQTAGLDFLSITDLNLFDKPSSQVGYHSNLLVMIDGEYSYLNSRLLNIGARTGRHLQGVGRSQVLFADLLSQAQKDSDVGLLVLAHPLKEKYLWTGEYPVGLDGLELINLKSIWAKAWRNRRWGFAVSLLMYPFNEKLALLRLFQSPNDEFALWDSLTRKRRLLGLAGADADAKLEIGGAKSFLRFPSYETLFSIARNHVLLRSELTGNASSDVEKLSTAMAQGRVYMSLDILGNPKGFNAYLKNRKGEVMPMGSKVNFEKGIELEVDLPQRPQTPFEVIIYRNGEKVLVSTSQKTSLNLSDLGTYRVMVRVMPALPPPDGRRWIPWIFTNPFYVI